METIDFNDAITQNIGVVEGLLMPKYSNSEINYGDFDALTNPMIRKLSKWSDTNYEKKNWPKIEYGTLIVENINGTIIQTAFGQKGISVRCMINGKWTGWSD